MASGSVCLYSKLKNTPFFFFLINNLHISAMFGELVRITVFINTAFFILSLKMNFYTIANEVPINKMTKNIMKKVYIYTITACRVSIFLTLAMFLNDSYWVINC